jgi:flagellar L-ring protein precursor FlgH
MASLLVLAMSIGTGYSASVVNLFSDHRAMRVDDILTILVDESAKAGSESGTTTSKENSMDLQSPGGSGSLRLIPGFGVSGGSKVGYDGKGGTTRAGSLVTTISARVIKVLDNGNLVIEGSKVVEINDEKEIIRITGIVRPQDVKKNNVISSSNVADASITYAGKGVANNGHRPGILARFLNWIF